MRRLNFDWSGTTTFRAVPLVDAPEMFLNNIFGNLSGKCEQHALCAAGFVTESPFAVANAAEQNCRTAVVAFGHVVPARELEPSDATGIAAV
jgi:hypothetical protein